MNLDTIVCGTPAELPHMLDARERRALLQRQLTDAWHVPLISFILNIPGPVKVFPLAEEAFEEGIRLIKMRCRSHGFSMVYETAVREFTGCEAIFAVDAPAISVKKILCQMEEEISMGRVFDIDVIDTDGSKISREQLGLPPRTCLLCGQQAFVCSRSRAHSIEELLTRECTLMAEYFSRGFARHISSLAARALLYEVCVTPKPGLVDRNNPGAHEDMDIFTFQASALALQPFFESFVLTGVQYNEEPATALFSRIRPLGIEAEEAMFQATGGVNTHKGMIFSMGIFCTALGQMFATAGFVGRPGHLFPGLSQAEFCSQISELSKHMTADLLDDFRTVTAQSARTHGERLYIRHGITGIRGEAANGYPAVFSLALPLFEQLAASRSINEAGVLTLLHIIGGFEDTNLIARSGYETAKQLQRQVSALLSKLLSPDSSSPDLSSPDSSSPASSLPECSAADPVLALDQQFIAKHASPGGSADILALTYFVWLLEQELENVPAENQTDAEV